MFDGNDNEEVPMQPRLVSRDNKEELKKQIDNMFLQIDGVRGKNIRCMLCVAVTEIEGEEAEKEENEDKVQVGTFVAGSVVDVARMLSIAAGVTREGLEKALTPGGAAQ